MVMDNDDALKREGAKPTSKKILGFAPLQMAWGQFTIDAVFRSNDPPPDRQHHLPRGPVGVTESRDFSTLRTENKPGQHAVHEPAPLSTEAAQEFKALSWVSWAMHGLLLGVFLLFVPHTALWLVREFKERGRKGGQP